VNDHPLRDVIDVQIYASDPELALCYERDGTRHTCTVRRRYGETLGLSFAQDLFDGDPRVCRNRCEFCFVRQMRPGLRKSLYIKDDDYRYSFLFGHFVTLTNLGDEDWDRLAEQRLSPLYVSVHATDPELRRRFLSRKAAPDILDQLRRLAGLNIEVHTQVVLVPGLNDGENLERTVRDLEGMRGRPVASVGVVPVGLTRYHPGRCRTYTPAESRALLAQVQPWREANRKRWGSTFVYPSDEWYLVAGLEVPPARDYDGFPQVENGVGMVRRLLDEWQALKGSLAGRKLRPATLACGTLIAPVLRDIVDELNELTGANWRLVPVVNEFFGPVTTVSGLLTGQDVVAALRRGPEPPGELALLPRAMFTGRYGGGSAPAGTTLDDMHITDVEAELGVPVRMAGTMAEALAASTEG